VSGHDHLGGVPGRPLRRQEASEAVSGLGWRYVLGVLRANLPAGSLVEAAVTAARVVAACGDDAAERLSVDLRRDQVLLTVRPVQGTLVTADEVALARRISEIASGLGLTTAAGIGGGSPRSVQVLEIAIDALDIAAVRPFWKAVLAYTDEPGHTGPEDPLVDPDGQGPAIWFQQMDAPRPNATASTSTSRYPTTRPKRAFGPPWPRAEHWSTTPRPPPSGSSPTPRATKPASPPGRAGTPSRRRPAPARRRRCRAARGTPSRPAAW
jgi:4a-hydroxytetrahydrobiopterin dehydratase